MSHVRHHAICVTSQFDEVLEKYRKRLIEIGLSPTEITPEVINGHRSFFVPPCGSKFGWNDSIEHMEKLRLAINISSEFGYEDGSNPLDCCLAVYGELIWGISEIMQACERRLEMLDEDGAE